MSFIFHACALRGKKQQQQQQQASTTTKTSTDDATEQSSAPHLNWVTAGDQELAVGFQVTFEIIVQWHVNKLTYEECFCLRYFVKTGHPMRTSRVVLVMFCVAPTHRLSSLSRFSMMSYL
jgi:hypothetical protein